MNRFVCCLVLIGVFSPPIRAQTTINGNSLALQSSGAAAGSGWNLTSNGYVGTYISLSQPGPVTFTLNASGTASNGLNPDMMISIADSNQTFNVTSSTATNYTYTTPTLAAGTYFIRTQLDDQTATQTPTLNVGSLTVGGTGVSVLNSNSSTNALSAATTYATNYREGPGTIALTNSNGIHLGAGTQVQVKLASNAFNFAAAVYGNSPYTNDSQWINVGPNGQNLPATTPEQISYQNAIRQNFNMIVPANAGKWVNDEFTSGSVNQNLLDAMTQFASQNNLRVRMHNLIWNTEQPPFINNLFAANGTLTAANKTTLNNAITSRINYYLLQGNSHTLAAPRTDTYTELDVLNEPFHGQSTPENYIGSGALGVSGVANVYSQVATAVANAGANTRLFTNEYNVLQFSPKSISSTGAATGSDPYANWYLNGVQGLQRAGAPIGGIGMELYTNASNNVDPVQMQQSMQNLSVAKDPSGKPIALSLTEFGVATGQTPTAANYDADLTTALTMAYGDPQTNTFGYWGGVGGPNDGNGSIYALYDQNYNLTSAGTTWQNWMNQYNTNVTLTTNASGQISFNGTYGLYNVTVGGQTYQLNLTKGTTNYGLMTPIGAATWNGAGANSNWSTSANWVGASFAANAPLIFAGSTGLSSNNDSPTNTQYSSITFNSGAGAFTLGGNAISLAGDVVNNSSSLQSININLALQTNTNFNTASGDLAISGAISGAFSLTKLGSHTLTLSGANSYIGSTTVTAGTLVVGAAGALPANTNVTLAGTSILQLAPNTGLATLSSLAIATGATFDINNNHIIINYGSGTDPIASIESWIAGGYAGGTWTGQGITSTAAQINSASYGIGFADSADPGNPANLPAGEIEIKYTLLGDVNLDGAVNGTDFALLAASFNKAVSEWDQGDFNYDGEVNGSDFASLAANFNQGASQSAIESFASTENLTTNIPEPALTGVLILASVSLLIPRRRNSEA